jgi:glucose-1-phosphate thymidylyltransferase
MKGIVLAGGSSTRLYPLTQVTSKQLLPIYDKPMVYYPLSILMLAGIREILIVTRRDEQAAFQRILGDGSQFGIHLSYAVQEAPRGIAEALIIAESFQKSEPVCLILGDNLLHGEGLPKFLQTVAAHNLGATIFGYRVQNPEAYGVVRLSKTGEPLELVEKPETFVSHYAIPGLYIYDQEAPSLAKQLKPSKRGELEITDLNKLYLERGKLTVERLGRGIAWLDTGTAESLFQAGQFVEVMEKRQGLKIACLEEIGYRMGYMSLEQLQIRAQSLKNNQYGQYLLELVRQEVEEEVLA